MGLTCASLHVFAQLPMNLDNFVQVTGDWLGCQRINPEETSLWETVRRSLGF
jgi:hypothetical protein